MPAVKGGAVETLVSNLLDENEINKLFDMTVISFGDAEAYEKSKCYKNVKFFFIKKTLAHKLGNKLIQLASRIIGGNDSLYYRIIRKQISRTNIEALVLEASAGYAERLHKDFPHLSLYFHVHNIPERHYVPDFSSYITGCLCISKFILNETMRLLNFERGKMHLLYNSVDTHLFCPVEAESKKNKLKEMFGFNAEDRLVIYTGRLQAFKGIRQLLEAFVQIKDENVKLLVVGASFFSASRSTPFIEELKSLAKSCESRIKFT